VAVGGGLDQVFASATHTLAVNVENLTLTGEASINGTGNVGANRIIGNSAANRLDGAGGADTLVGGLGDDIYVVDNALNAVTELAAEGTDLVLSSVTHTLALNVENLTLTGLAAINGTGNDDANVITGNDANNVLNGLIGADTLIGGLGNDTYVVEDAGDVLIESLNAGTDLVQSSVDYTLAANLENLTLTGLSAIDGTGNALANIITGNSGSNVLRGLGGDDTYVVGSAGDTVIELAGEGNDLVQSAFTYVLAGNIERLTLTGAAAINGTGNGDGNTITGNAGNNVLDGLAGADRLIGGGGNDTYVVDNAGDVVTEALNEGTDLVQSAVTFVLGANIENLTLTGVDAINGTGNAVANVITGNGADNVLDGGLGSDTMRGGAGNDTYVVDNVSDVVTEIAEEGTDLVQSSVSYTLGANLENLSLTGALAIRGTGNELNNVLTGNGANNTLTGGGGDDTLEGGAGTDALLGGLGNDTYIIADAVDLITEAVGAGTDQVLSSVSHTLGVNVENLSLTGTAAINGTGNTAANVIGGNSGNNTLSGLAGDDILSGEAGIDILIGGAGADTLSGGLGADIFRFLAAGDSGLGATLRDVITDYRRLTDRIDLAGIDANVNVAGNQAFTLIGAAAFTAAGQLRFSFDGTQTVIQANVDATTGADFEIALLGSHALTNGDFVL
jgi:Ca2+-binding RTX toxin-like protein